MADLTQYLYWITLATAPLAFAVAGVALLAVQGDVFRGAGFLAVAAAIGGASVYIWREG